MRFPHQEYEKATPARDRSEVASSVHTPCPNEAPIKLEQPLPLLDRDAGDQERAGVRCAFLSLLARDVGGQESGYPLAGGGEVAFSE